VRAYNDLGFALVKAGRAGEALALLGRGAARFPAVAAVRKNAALAALASGDAMRARSEADAALALQPRYAEALAVRARSRARLGDPAGARRDFAAFLESGPPTREMMDETAQDLAAWGVTVVVPPPGADAASAGRPAGR
jgi:Tfp pilus assembly protein PilF